MARVAPLAGLLLALGSAPVMAREAVDASAPQDLSVTIYRDPQRGEGDAMNRGMPRGFAMISETRQVTLPAGDSTIRFTGVAEGMVAVSAIVTGLPGGTIEKNRNADLLSPAALVDGTLGNRVRITRTNPASGEPVSEDAVLRTRADGGIVLQTAQGYEAVRCSGLPEKLTFSDVPAGLSAQPVFSIDTRDETGGTYTVTLTYISWGFDWEAHYVARLGAATRAGKQDVQLMSWLTLLNDNGQSFDNAQLMAVAGSLNVESDFEGLSDPPEARPLRITCYPIGSTSTGSPVPFYGPLPPPPPPPPPPAPMMAYADEAIMVTGSRVSKAMQSAPAMVAAEEALGDLKLYRVPERVSVNAKGVKQIAFLDKDKVEGEIWYEAACDPWEHGAGFQPMGMLFATVNDGQHGLGAALPTGGITIFEESAYGDLLVAEESLRDFAEGQDVEISLGESSQVHARCELSGKADLGENTSAWRDMRVTVTNANRNPVNMRLLLGSPAYLDIPRKSGMRVKDGGLVLESQVRANSERSFSWKVRLANR